MAARTLDLPMWQAGQQLLSTADPTAFRRIIVGDKIVTANREAIERCQRSATKAGYPERCTISIAPAERGNGIGDGVED